MDFITVPIGWLLKFFSTVCGNSYILAILLFSIVMEILMALIFGIKQQKNSIKQARLRPKEMAIRNKYKGRDDKPTQQKMTQDKIFIPAYVAVSFSGHIGYLVFCFYSF